MHQFDSQPTHAAASDVLDAAILTVSLNEEANGPWSVDDLAREFGRDLDNGLRRLYGAGLVRRLDGFVWATRAAVMAAALA